MKKIFISTLLIASCALLGACSAVKKGDRHFKRGEYEYAIERYQEALEKGSNAGYANLRIAESYRLSNRMAEAAPFYEAAINSGLKIDSIQFYYGFALKDQGKYDAARQQLEEYTRQGNDPERVKHARQEIENLGEVKRILENQDRYEVRNFESLNTEAADFAPIFLDSDQEMIFTSARGDGKVYAATGGGFTDLYTFTFDGSSEFGGNVKAMDNKFNLSGVHEASATFSKDGKTMIFARGNNGSKRGRHDVDLYISYYRNGEWTEPELMPIPINDPNAWDSTPAFSGDGRSLYFASNREGGFGGTDIWRATRDGNGRWSRVQNMGKTINTAGNELFPYVSDDGKLYYASDGLPSLGGLDIFVATRARGEGIEVENMGAPINSRWDDFGIAFRSPIEGYLSSNREGGKGDDDIYYFKDVKGDIKSIDYVLVGKTMTTDSTGTEKILPNTTVRLLDPQGKTLAEATTGKDGSFKFDLSASANYELLGEKPQYFTKREPFTTYGKAIPQEELERDTTITLAYNLMLDEVVVDKPIVLDNIYYDLDKANIRPDAARELDKLVQVLKDNPNLTIELSSHTDARDTEAYNLKLSQRRAESAVEYLVSQGIDPERLQARGYGESRLLILDAQTEEEHQQNRRTEFKVLRK
ncbi:WD40-like Beta Propeller Repeat [Catalinimonas alkaloidigena]|uniref:WD40-like Beta Propeller Repeat n=1 Tax=Catalinimonas alkaloidigena TaxID=1075417 RepID=A0A1G9ATF8_9BACT|nr:OmpA family protein [Catalinimonas alkaloidigena]SDK29930.1 WD40-like Beta Propeller Repeat [Catalinimonas alkaloidigena]